MLIAVWRIFFFFCRLRYFLGVISLSQCNQSEELTCEASVLILRVQHLCKYNSEQGSG